MLVAATAGLCIAVSSGSASAGNAEHPRTPVEWNDVGCMEFVDRTVEPQFSFAYAIPFEDTDLTPDEVDNSRTHQFFAICRPLAPHESLPSWISTADVAQASNNYEELTPPASGDVLETAVAWDGCWHRITEDDARRPITDAMAAEPIVWDTSTVPVGDYVVWGYTYEPIFNLWAPRSGGVVRVHDGGEPAERGPAAAVTSGEQAVCVGDTVRVEGCVDALPGATMNVAFALSTPDVGEPEWVPVAEGVDVDGDTFVIEWTAPEAAGGASVMVRVDITDPNGETYPAYQHELDIILPAPSAGCGGEVDDCEVGFVMDPACETGNSATGTDPSTGASQEPAADGGSGCRFAPHRPFGTGILVVLGLVGLVRLRRRAM